VPGDPRSASQPVRDLRPVAAIIVSATELVPFPEPTHWNQPEIGFHRTINELGGSHELVELAERMHRKVQAMCVQSLYDRIYGPDRRQLMQTDHLCIVDAVRHGRVDEAEALTRAHLHFIRDRSSKRWAARSSEERVDG
jgi:DNA-binding GntR family transcriptional regulator